MLLKEKKRVNTLSWKKHSEIKALRLLSFNMYERDKLLFVLYKALPILFFLATVGENIAS